MKAIFTETDDAFDWFYRGKRIRAFNSINQSLQAIPYCEHGLSKVFSTIKKFSSIFFYYWINYLFIEQFLTGYAHNADIFFY